MIIDILFPTLGGLGLFIYGMKIMSEGLQRVAGERLRKILATVSSNRVVACATGAIVTGVIQSSSATMVMLVGFVNAGLLTFTQSVGVTLGANIGTTITAQIIAFKISAYALPAIAIGSGMKMFSKTRRNSDLGVVILGFGLIFFGMSVMKDGVAPLKESQFFVQMFTHFTADGIGGVLLCVLVGAGLTMILQSSSATVGLTMTLATQGLISFPGAVALILGENIGTTITAELASIGSGSAAHKTARAHTLFNVIGVGYMVPLFPFFVRLVGYVSAHLMGLGPVDQVINGEQPNVARYIAIAHTMFNVVNATVFLIGLKYLIRAAEMLTPESKRMVEGDLGKPVFLDMSFIDVPSVALEQARREIKRMGQIAEDMFDLVMGSIDKRELRSLNEWRVKETALDQLQREVTNYLVTVSQTQISLADSRQINRLMRMSTNMERIGDSIENLAELIEEMIESNLFFSSDGLDDFWAVAQKVREFLDFTIARVTGQPKDLMEVAGKMEADIDLMQEEMRGKYLIRLREGTCTLDPGLIFTDMLYQFEKIGDYCFNIVQALAGKK